VPAHRYSNNTQRADVPRGMIIMRSILSLLLPSVLLLCAVAHADNPPPSAPAAAAGTAEVTAAGTTFTLPADFAAEQTEAYAHFTSGALLAKARAALDDDNPLDTWFYGAARVRAKLRMLEDAVMLWDSRGLRPGDLSAVQLPHKAGAPWLALDFPKEDAPDSERLAYIAFAPQPGYDPSAPRCGLLLDDWSETIPAIDAEEPGPQHTTGVAFNFDRPSQEPPQAMLLLTPAQWDGAWSWDDIQQGVVDTFALARLRAVEPAQVDDSALAQFLPATVASVTTSGLSISANFALVNMDVHYARTVADG